MELKEAIKIIDYDFDVVPTDKEIVEANEIFFDKIFGVAVKNQDGTYKSMMDVFEEAHTKLTNIRAR